MKTGKAKTNFFGMNRPCQGIGGRVLSWPLTSLVFFVFSMVLAAPAEGATVRDEFDEAGGPSAGFVQVTPSTCTSSNCLRLGYPSGSNDNTGADREANLSGARTDISVRDVLDPAFQYQLESIQVDNSVAECAAAICAAAEELAIFTAVNGAPVLTDALGDDVVSYATATINAGNRNVGNLQLDINANAVWAILFSVKMP